MQGPADSPFGYAQTKPSLTYSLCGKKCLRFFSPLEFEDSSIGGSELLTGDDRQVPDEKPRRGLALRSLDAVRLGVAFGHLFTQACPDSYRPGCFMHGLIYCSATWPTASNSSAAKFRWKSRYRRLAARQAHRSGRRSQSTG